MIPFIFLLGFPPQGCTRHHAGQRDSILVYHRPFLLFSEKRKSEVPATNKPRRACLYVNAGFAIPEKALAAPTALFTFSALFSPACGRVER
jgi:hypothetical protein